MPHGLAPRAVVPKNQAEMELISSVIRWRNPEKKCEKRVSTRENRELRAEMPPWLQRAARAQSIVCSGNLRCCSFSLLKVFQKCSQLIHMRFFPSSPVGLRLEIRFKIDKKKMNFIFWPREKIFLTKKRKRACPRENKKIDCSNRFIATRMRSQFVTAAAN
jgi:hypothetical protein